MYDWMRNMSDWRILAATILSGGVGWLAGRGRRQSTVRTLPIGSRSSADLLESLYAGLGDACLLVTSAGEILYANEGASDLLGSSSGIVGRRLSQVIPDPRVSELITSAMAQKQGTLEDEFSISVMPRGRSEERYFVFNAAAVNLPDQPELLVRLVVRDETRRQETEQIRRDFVANASHELRTPLAIINGYLENLVEGTITDPVAVNKSLNVMQKHGERLERLVEDMLIISRYEATDSAQHRAELLAKRFSCRECVTAVLERLLPLVENKQARMVLEIPPDDEVAGDAFYWEQIFFNLIENSLKENAEAERLVITVIMERKPNSVQISVRDNGKGIPHEHLPFIFKRFYRVATDHSQQKVKGTGLGLSIVKRAVEAHGGTIRVESSPGFRTEFIMDLPKIQ
jgi:signal transduction histidine kinase